MFKYFAEAGLEAPALRVLSEEAKAYEEDDKYEEVGFKLWFEKGIADDTKELYLKDAPEGCFSDPSLGEDPMVLSLEDGEPVEDEEKATSEEDVRVEAPAEEATEEKEEEATE